jgi:hypothetical protein
LQPLEEALKDQLAAEAAASDAAASEGAAEVAASDAAGSEVAAEVTAPEGPVMDVAAEVAAPEGAVQEVTAEEAASKAAAESEAASAAHASRRPPWIPHGTAAPLDSMETPFQTQARENYAKEHDVDVATVSVRTVMESECGLQAYAFKHIDVSAQGNLGRALSRELQKPEHEALAKTVKYLPPTIAEKFRMGWASTPTRGFEFLVEGKVSETYTLNTQGKEREWLTLGGLAKEFGDPNGEEEKMLAWRWACGCWAQDDPSVEWCRWSSFLGVWKYAYEKDKEKDEDGEKHANVTKQNTTTNMWEQAAKENKAVLNYAAQHGLKPSHVTQAMVMSSPLGLEGWSIIAEPRVGGRPRASDKQEASSSAASRRKLVASSSDATEKSSELGGKHKLKRLPKAKKAGKAVADRVEDTVDAADAKQKKKKPAVSQAKKLAAQHLKDVTAHFKKTYDSVDQLNAYGEQCSAFKARLGKDEDTTPKCV